MDRGRAHRIGGALVMGCRVVVDGVVHVPVVSPDRPVDDGLADFLPLLAISEE